MLALLSRHKLTLVAVVVTAFLFSAGPSVARQAAVAFAENSHKVDGKHAVGAGASVANRKGKLVATSGTTGRLPNNIIGKAKDANKLDGIDSTGFVTTPGQMRIVVAGTLQSNGTVLTGTENFTATRESAGRYVVDIPSVNYFYADYVAVATAASGNATSSSIGGDLLLQTQDMAGVATDSQVNFVVYEIAAP